MENELIKTKTDYQIAKEVLQIELHESRSVVVADVPAFRRYLCQVAKKAGISLVTRIAGENTLSIFRTQ